MFVWGLGLEVTERRRPPTFTDEVGQGGQLSWCIVEWRSSLAGGCWASASICRHVTGAEGPKLLLSSNHHLGRVFPRFRGQEKGDAASPPRHNKQRTGGEIGATLDGFVARFVAGRLSWREFPNPEYQPQCMARQRTIRKHYIVEPGACPRGSELFPSHAR